MILLTRLGPLAILTVLAAACSSGGAPAGASSGGAGASDPELQSGPEDAGQAPIEPTERMRSQAASVASALDALSSQSAWHVPVDVEAAKARERASILSGDGSDATFFASAWRAVNTFPQGHQGFFSQTPGICGKSIPLQSRSRFGVCGRPSASGVAVTFAASGNRLGLARGDVVVRAGGDEGDALFEAAYLRPICGAVYPSRSGRRHAGAASFFGTVPAGMKLTVRSPSGTTRELVVPAEPDAEETDCREVFHRSISLYADASIRPDGVAVIRLPNFLPFDKAPPTTEAGFASYEADYQAKLVAIFDTVKHAPAIIWDARGNEGGITPVGLAIVAGFSSARATELSYCQTRVAGSSPPSFDGPRYASYVVAPGGPFSYAGKVAIVTDGLAYSAGDYFPFAASQASNVAVVGSPTAGAFGGGAGPISIPGPPSLGATFDPTGCFRASDGAPLEASPPSPRVGVEYDPKDLAAGIDTVLERAVVELAH